MSNIVKIKEQESINPLMLIQNALDSGATPESLDKLMDLQERHERNQAKKAFNHAMSEFSKNAPKIVKDGVVGYTNKKGGVTGYKHVTLASAVNAVQDTMSELGLSHRWQTNQDNNGINVRCVITHEMGHSESTSLTAPPDMSGKKNNIQAIGSTVTYLQRYTLFSALGLAAFEDDDAAGTTTRVRSEYSQDDFDAKFPEWVKLIENNERNAISIITFLQNSFNLTKEQKVKLLELKKIEVKNAK